MLSSGFFFFFFLKKETEILIKKKVSDLKWIACPVTGYGHQIQIGWGGNIGFKLK